MFFDVIISNNKAGYLSQLKNYYANYNFSCIRNMLSN
jgi:hypothetical protein